MTPERYARVKEIFAAAIEAQPTVRREAAERAAAGDAALLDEVLSLLREHEAAERAMPAVDGGGPSEGGEPLPPDPGRTAALGARRAKRRRTARVLAAALALVFAMGVGLWAFARMKQAWKELVGQELRATLDATVAGVEGHIHHRLEEAARLAADPQITRDVAEVVSIADQLDQPAQALSASPANRRLGEWALARLRALGGIDYFVVSPAFVCVSSSRPAFLGRQPHGDVPSNLGNLMQAFSGSARFGPPRVLGSSTGTPVPGQMVVWYAAPVRQAGGHVLAVLGVGFDAHADFARFFHTSRVAASEESYAFGADGTMLSDSRFERELRQAGLVPRGGSSMASLVLRDPGGDITAGFRPSAADYEAAPLTRLVARAVAAHRSDGRPRQGVLTEPYHDYRGVEVVGAWRWVASLELGIATEIDLEEVQAPLRSLYAAAGVLAALAMLAFAGMLASSFSLVRLRSREPTRLGPYILLDKIGEGGLGDIFLARHELLKRRTVIKVLKPSVVDAETMARFEREVQATSRLTHHNTVTIYDFGRTPTGGLYYVMEHLEGVSLARLIELEGRLPVARAVHLLRQACASLREAHDMGLVHRDVKPQNMMVTRRGGEHDVVKVIDFGLVKDLARVSEETLRTTRISGTPLYMAPERILGGPADPRADVYSLGGVAFKMLTGQDLFHSPSDLGLLYDVLHASPRALSELASDVPAALERLVAACVAKKPEDRPPTIASVMASLESLAVDCPWTESDARAAWAAHPTLLSTPPWW